MKAALSRLGVAIWPFAAFAAMCLIAVGISVVVQHDLPQPLFGATPMAMASVLLIAALFFMAIAGIVVVGAAALSRQSEP